MDPDDVAVGPDVPLFHLVLGQLPRANASDELAGGGNVLWMCQLLDLELEDFLPGVARDLAVALIDRDPFLGKSHMGDADRRLLERGEEQMPRAAQRDGVFSGPAGNGGRGR